MQQQWFQTDDWYRALNLRERLATFSADGSSPARPTNGELARSRLERWRAEPPFAHSDAFAQKLTLEDATEAEVLLLLGESAQELHGRVPAPPAWLKQLEETFSPEAFTHELDLADGDNGFLILIQPFVDQGRARLRAGIEALMREFPQLPFRPDEAEDMLLENLYALFPMKINRTLVLELNVARLRGLLSGTTAEERFQSFLHRLHDRDAALGIMQEYPVLARQLTTCLNHWAEFSLEFLRRLCEDSGAIREALTPDRDPGLLASISGGAGDSHARGRTVIMAEFESGFRVVYKPKSVAVVQHFQDLLGWLNDCGADPPLRRIQVVERGTHGWIEFIVHEGCTKPEEVERFYQRQGAFLALFYALEATDFHSENVIASGEHALPIDLEALFHPRFGSAAAPNVDHLASDMFNGSVMRVGLLPEFIWGNEENEGVDISGFGDRAGQISPHGVPDWDQLGTDEMRLVRRHVPMEGSQNRPSLNDADVDVLDYVDVIADGFTRMYRLLLTRRDEMLSPEGPLARFATDEVRAVLRPTRTYFVLLQESFHPDVLRDALDRDRIFDRLYGWLERNPRLAKVISAELEDLNLGDIPIFSTRPQSCDLWDSMGRRIPRYFMKSGMELVRQRMEHMSEADMQRQLWFIQASFGSLASARGFVNPAPKQIASSEAAGRDQLLAAALAVGDRLGQQAIHNDGEATWFALLHFKGKHWRTGSLGLDLYSGLPGVALFLAYLGSVTGDARSTELARGALATMRRQRSREAVRWVGAFGGLGGMIYALTHLSALWNDEALVNEAELIIASLPPLIDADPQLDIISGSAGCIGALLAYYDRTRSPAALAAAIRCGEHLLAKAVPAGPGLGWIVPNIASKPLAGFSHGAAGIAWALLQLAARTDSDRFRQAAVAAIAYERSLFSPQVANWLDVRDFPADSAKAQEQTERHSVAWCHGAPGIGLARLGSLSQLDDPLVQGEIEVALRTTLASGFGQTPTLCHGDLGNLDLLLEASAVLGDSRWQEEANRRAGSILKGIETNGWLCATPLRVESPGLLTGLAGIGYGLLRLAEPGRVPSVLNLSPPRAASV
jgi:type 2 lantibiotic biosynthesis protein LanM